MYWLSLGVENLCTRSRWRKRKSDVEMAMISRSGHSHERCHSTPVLLSIQPSHSIAPLHHYRDHRDGNSNQCCTSGTWYSISLLLTRLFGVFAAEKPKPPVIQARCSHEIIGSSNSVVMSQMARRERSDESLSISRSTLVPASRSNASKYLSGTSMLSGTSATIQVDIDNATTAAPSRVPSPIPEGRPICLEDIGATCPSPEFTTTTATEIRHQPTRPNHTVRQDSFSSVSLMSQEPAHPSTASESSLPWFLEHLPFLLSIVLVPFAGIPLVLTIGHTATLDTLVLFAFWFGTMSLQAVIRHQRESVLRLSTSHSRFRWFLRHLPTIHGGVVVLLNAVLVSSLGMVAYILVKDAADGSVRNLEQSLHEFVTHQNISSLLSHNNGKSTMGAGDIALAILDAGIVVWGFKLFECRDQLLSMSGITVLIVSSIAAISNFFLGPMLGHAMGLAGPESAAFAARSVTLALGGPVVQSMGGNLTINAAMVVLNGLVFQIGGDWIFARMGLNKSQLDKNPTTSSSHDSSSSSSSAYDRVSFVTTMMSELPANSNSDQDNKPRLIAAGVSVGINAAAMGTAHLYERCSDAAPFAALSMTVIGVATVIIAAINPAIQFVVDHVGSVPPS